MAHMQMHKSSLLKLPDINKVKNELGLVDPFKITVGDKSDPELESKAAGLVKDIFNINFDDHDQLDIIKNIGQKIQQEAANMGNMLKEPIKNFAEKGEDGGVVANSVVELNKQLGKLDPKKVKNTTGWFSRLINCLPLVSSPLKKFFAKFESAQMVLDTVICSLDEGKNILMHDNTKLANDQRTMRIISNNLNSEIKLCMLIDHKMSYALENKMLSDAYKYKFCEENLLSTLRDRTGSLLLQLTTIHQIILAIDIIIRNNKELIKGMQKGIDVTVKALSVAEDVALVLTKHHIVLNNVEALTKGKDKVAEQARMQLEKQKDGINEQACDDQPDMETLKKAFADINETLNNITTFRKKAVPQMAENIMQIDTLIDTSQ